MLLWVGSRHQCAPAFFKFNIFADLLIQFCYRFPVIVLRLHTPSTTKVIYTLPPHPPHHLRLYFHTQTKKCACTARFSVLPAKTHPLRDFPNATCHYANYHINPITHAPYIPLAPHFQWPGSTEHVHAVSASRGQKSHPRPISHGTTSAHQRQLISHLGGQSHSPALIFCLETYSTSTASSAPPNIILILSLCRFGWRNQGSAGATHFTLLGPNSLPRLDFLIGGLQHINYLISITQ